MKLFIVLMSMEQSDVRIPSPMLFCCELHLLCGLLFTRSSNIPSLKKEYLSDLQTLFGDVGKVHMTKERIKTKYNIKASLCEFHKGNDVWPYVV